MQELYIYLQLRGRARSARPFLFSSIITELISSTEWPSSTDGSEEVSLGLHYYRISSALHVSARQFGVDSPPSRIGLWPSRRESRRGRAGAQPNAAAAGIRRRRLRRVSRRQRF